MGQESPKVYHKYFKSDQDFEIHYRSRSVSCNIKYVPKSLSHSCITKLGIFKVLKSLILALLYVKNEKKFFIDHCKRYWRPYTLFRNWGKGILISVLHHSTSDRGSLFYAHSWSTLCLLGVYSGLALGLL